MKTKKIIKVLKFIKKYCKSNKECKDCPFNYSICEYLPVDWDIEKLEKEWKGLEELKIEKSGNKKK